MADRSSGFDADYYRSHCGENYERGNGWEEIFGNIAAHIIKELAPHCVLDVGCASGYLVETLINRGTAAEGIDISDYALSCVPDSVKPYCIKRSVTETIEKKYDLITCIEVMEHLEKDEIAKAISNICEATDVVIFSSTPFDYDEETHISVHSPEYWSEQFAYNGFYHDVKYDCSYISVQAMLFRRVEKTKIDLIRDYEAELFRKHQENVAIRRKLKTTGENLVIYQNAYQKHVDMINNELNPRIAELNRMTEQLILQKDDENSYSDRQTEKTTLLEKRLEDEKRMYEVRLEEERTAYRIELEQQKELFKEQLEDQEKEYRMKFEKQEALNRKQLQEEKMTAQRQLEAQEKVFRRRLDERRRQYINSFSEEVALRQYYEEKHYQAVAEHKELEIMRIENSQIKRTIDLLKYTIRNHTISFLNYLKYRYENRKESRRLMKADLKNREYIFNSEFYYTQYPDLQKAFGKNEKKLYRHFIYYGMNEGRRANESFDVYAYMAYNPDVVEKLKDDTRAYYLHYLTEGRALGRRAL